MAAVTRYSRWYDTNNPDIYHRLYSIRIWGKGIYSATVEYSDTLDASSGTVVTIYNGTNPTAPASNLILYAPEGLNITYKAKIRVSVTGATDGTVPEIHDPIDIYNRPEFHLSNDIGDKSLLCINPLDESLPLVTIPVSQGHYESENASASDLPPGFGGITNCIDYNDIGYRAMYTPGSDSIDTSGDPWVVWMDTTTRITRGTAPSGGGYS